MDKLHLAGKEKEKAPTTKHYSRSGNSEDRKNEMKKMNRKENQV